MTQSSPRPPSHNDDTLAGEYVLGTLDTAARVEVERRLQYDSALRDAVDRWETRFAPYSALATPVEPSPGLWSRIERSIDTAHRTPPSHENPRPRPGWWQSLALWRATTFAGAAAALILALTLLQTPGTPQAPRFVIVLMTPQHTQAGWLVQAASPDELELVPLGRFELPPGKALEFWTKADDWKGPVSLGLIKPGERSHLNLDDLPPLENNQLFELTLEDAGGSPLGRPSGPIEFIGRAVSL
ncbi:anti-sigma factor [Salinicola rhizosphaerae]|uniref:Regulator of SigK n=1 Tax=Salinicola rhizosphaerae TaxID=1443141 RepID=A0ABQ3E6C7_9GAMM|nr:anti-sigma factor [Salinicola rhizosphaerae]GHB27538.1 DNA-directed RNA polymerase sigma-70 factor [Salinicola rhizosphaerae]